MFDGQLLIVAALIGACAALGVVAVIYSAIRYSLRANTLTNAMIPEGIDAALKAIPLAAFATDGSLTVIATNAAAERLGFHRREGLAVEGLDTILQTVRNTGTAEQRALTVPHRRGSDSYWDVVAAPFGGRHIFVVVTDRTQEHLADQMRRDFTANVSHELKTPIAAAQLLTEAIDQGADDPDRVHRFAHSLMQEVQRLGAMVNDIIQLSSIENESDRATFHPVDVGEVVESVVDRTQHLADEKSIECVVKASGGLQIWGRKRLVDNIAIALVENAIQYSPSGSRVGIELAEADNTVVLTVSDHGVGIPVSEQDRVFERFYRVDAAHSPNTSGTGLGLSIVRNAVRVLGGEIKLWSRPKMGSTFTIRLPRAEKIRQ